MAPDLESVARAVVARRGELRLRQQDLARASGVSVRAIQKLEAGATWPWVRTRQAISRALGMPLTWLDDLATPQGRDAPERPFADDERELDSTLRRLGVPEDDRDLLMAIYRQRRDARTSK